MSNRAVLLMQCIFLGGIVGVFLGTTVLITIGFLGTAAYQATGGIVDNGFAPFAPLAVVGQWFWLVGPGTGVLTVITMWGVRGAVSARSVALCAGLTVGTLVAIFAIPRDIPLWEQIWIGGALVAAPLSIALVSAQLAKYP